MGIGKPQCALQSKNIDGKRIGDFSTYGPCGRSCPGGTYDRLQYVYHSSSLRQTFAFDCSMWE